MCGQEGSHCPRLPCTSTSISRSDRLVTPPQLYSWKLIRLVDALQPNGKRWNSRFRKLPGKSNGKSTVPRREVGSIKKVRSRKCFELWPEFKHQFLTKSNHSNKCSRSIKVPTSAKHWSKARNKPKLKHKRWNRLKTTYSKHIGSGHIETTYAKHIENHILETYPKLETHIQSNHHVGRPRGLTRKEGVTPT